MKRTLAFLLSAGTLVTLGCARRGPESSVWFRPARPAVGDSLVVTYLPGTKSPLADADSVFLHIQIYSAKTSSQRPEGHEYRMQKRGHKSQAGFRIAREDAGCILLQFVSDHLRDDNGKVAWHLLIHDRDGKPVEGAYFALAQTYLSPVLIQREPDKEKALEYLQKEVSLHPDHLQARLLLLSLQSRKAAEDSSLRARILTSLDSLVQARGDDPDVLARAYGIYSRLRETDKADRVLEKLREVKPDHDLLLGMEWSKIRDLPTTEEQIARGLEFYRKVRGTEFEGMVESWLANTLLSAKRWREAVAFVDTLRDPSPGLLNSVAWKLVEENRMLAQAASLAEKAIALYRKGDMSRKPVYLPERRWRESQRRGLGYTLDTYAYAVYKMGELEKALKAFREAYELTDGASPDINQRYIQCLMDLGRKQEAYEVAREVVAKGQTNDEINELLVALARELKGSTAEADSLIAAWKAKTAELRQKKLREKFLETPEPTPSFELVSLEGDTVSLASLKGKIVILDFWATWCGPCKASFPYLQKFWEQHRNDPDLALYAVNCWERKPEGELVAHIRDFLQKNGYTFPVLLDAKNEVVRAFKVSGIPTKFFLGPDGKIYVKDVGFGGPDMLEEMNQILLELRKRFATT